MERFLWGGYMAAPLLFESLLVLPPDYGVRLFGSNWKNTEGTYTGRPTEKAGFNFGLELEFGPRQ